MEQDLVWHNFHESFMPLIREIIGAQLGADYVVKIDEHRISDAARYENWIYRTGPEPALSAEDQRWVQQFLPETESSDTHLEGDR
jgi:hypothetical protein